MLYQLFTLVIMCAAEKELWLIVTALPQEYPAAYC